MKAPTDVTNDNKTDTFVSDDKYCGADSHKNNKIWYDDSEKHYTQLRTFGFTLLHYVITEPGTCVQWLIAVSNDNPNILYVIFKGTSNPIDGTINLGLHPIYFPHLQCSVVSGMYAAMQQTFHLMVNKLLHYSQTKSNIDTLIIAGHSLGGSYSQLFYAYWLSVMRAVNDNHFQCCISNSSNKNDTITMIRNMEHNNFVHMKVVTFGSPLAFSDDVRESYLYPMLQANCIHFIYQFDIIPRLQNGMQSKYRSTLVQGLINSSYFGVINFVYDLGPSLNIIISKLEESQWMLDKYTAVGRHILLFDAYPCKKVLSKKECFVRLFKGQHLPIDSKWILSKDAILTPTDYIEAQEIMRDHKILHYLTKIIFR